MLSNLLQRNIIYIWEAESFVPSSFRIIFLKIAINTPKHIDNYEKLARIHSQLDQLEQP